MVQGPYFRGAAQGGFCQGCDSSDLGLAKIFVVLDVDSAIITLKYTILNPGTPFPSFSLRELRIPV